MGYYSKQIELFAAWGIERHLGGHIKVKAVNCNKPKCHTCPHKYYAYHVTTNGYLAKSYKYLGTCNADGTPRRSTNKVAGLYRMPKGLK